MIHEFKPNSVENNILKGDVRNGKYEIIINFNKNTIKTNHPRMNSIKFNHVNFIELNENECNGDYNDIICEHWHKVKT